MLCKVPLIFYPAPPPPSQQWIISDYANPSDVLEMQIAEPRLEMTKKCIFWQWNADGSEDTDTQTMLGYSSLEPSQHIDLRIQESRKENRWTGADPTSTEAVEAAARGLRNDYLTFRDRRGGFSLELKRSKEQLSCIPAISYTSLSKMAFKFRVFSLCISLCLLHVCMCIFACMSLIHTEIRTPVDLC